MRTLVGLLMALLMLSSVVAGCLGTASNDAMGEQVVAYAATNATIVQGNVWACNAVIQVIDYVLVPQSAISSDQ